MRLGEIRNIVKETATSDGVIVIDFQNLYGDQIYRVRRYNRLMRALDLLSTQGWNKIDYAPVAAIQEEHGTTVSPADLTPQEFNELNAYVATLNQSLPIFLGIADSLVPRQDEQSINIKLPENIRTLAGLSTRNTKLTKLFKEFTIDGDVEFRGFDVGSDWYNIAVLGTTTYTVVIGCLKVAQQFFDTRKSYYDSQKAKLDYEAGLKEGELASPAAFKEYQDKRMHLEIEDEVRKVLEQIGDLNGRSAPEEHSRLVIATKDLIEQLGDGVEFHLSLNPPSYAKEQQGSLTIDYKKVREINQAKAPKQKKLEPPKSAGSGPANKDKA